MKPSEKLLKAFDEFRPHLSGHKTAIELFLFAIEEVKYLEQKSNINFQTIKEGVFFTDKELLLSNFEIDPYSFTLLLLLLKFEISELISNLFL